MNEGFLPKYTSKYNVIGNHCVKTSVKKGVESNHEVVFSPVEVKKTIRKPLQNSYIKRLEKEKMRRYD